jgi:prepilin-type N-terminal cleavage/methylation domain-containing protein
MSSLLPMRTPPFRHRQVPARAFTLVEMLTVLGLIALLSAAAVPAFQAFRGASRISRAASDIATTLDQARAYAMANNTYVYVAFAERDMREAGKEGRGQVIMTVLSSRDGTRSFGTGNQNLLHLGRIHRLEALRLADSLPNEDALARPAVESGYRLGNEAFPSASTVDASGYRFSKMIRFDPRGTAGVPGNGSFSAIPKWIEIALSPAGGGGGGAEGAGNCAAIVLDGVTGSSKIYRP